MPLPPAPDLADRPDSIDPAIDIGEPEAASSGLLHRPDGAVLTGASIRLANRLDVETVWVRLALVALTLVNGAGVALYAAAWLAAPTLDGERQPPPRRALAVGCAAVAAGLVAVTTFIPITVPVLLVVLAAVAVALWKRVDDRPPSPWMPPPPRSWVPPEPRPPRSAQRAVDDGGDDGASHPARRPNAGAASLIPWIAVVFVAAAMAAIVMSAFTSRPDDFSGLIAMTAVVVVGLLVASRLRTAGPTAIAADGSMAMRLSARERRRLAPAKQRSMLASFTLGIAALLAGVLAIARQGGTDIAGHEIAGAAALVLGAGVLIGTVWGRARWLVVPAIGCCAVAVVGAATDGMGLRWSLDQDSIWRSPQTVADIPRSIDTTVGDIDLWLSDVDFAGQTVPMQVRVAVGSVDIFVPSNVDVRVRSRIGVGSADVLGRSTDGYRRDLTVAGDVDRSTGRLEIDVAVGVGTIDVHRVAQPFGEVNVLADGALQFADGTTLAADGTAIYSESAEFLGDGRVLLPTGATIDLGQGVVTLSSGEVLLIPPGPIAPGPIPPGLSAPPPDVPTTMPTTSTVGVP
jgi:phage shock protein PspC (stress-responsive transcriptional regulator)